MEPEKQPWIAHVPRIGELRGPAWTHEPRNFMTSRTRWLSARAFFWQAVTAAVHDLWTEKGDHAMQEVDYWLAEYTKRRKEARS